jgi:phosphatidylglycerophosphate synthase
MREYWKHALPLIEVHLIFYTIFNTSFEAFPPRIGLRHGARSIDLEKGHILLADKGLIQQLLLRYHILSKGNLTYAVRLADLIAAVPTTLVIWRAYGLRKTIRYLVGFTMALTAQRAFISAMIHKIGREQSSLADALTLSRGANGAVLAGLVTSGVRDRNGVAGWIGWLMPLLGVTDWLDGTLARRAGPTRLGGVLDIEADSWLTLWCAAGAVTWGNLPRWCLLPPLMHYLEPLLALMQGNLPHGGGPWWYRVAGASQMGLLIGALAPFDWRKRKRILHAASLPVSMGQCAAIGARLARKLKKRHGK